MENSKSENPVFKLLLVGEASVGKSCLLKRYVSNQFETRSESTIGVDYMIKILRREGERIKLKIWDTAGNERFRSLTRNYYRDTHGVILVYDVTRRETFERLDPLISDVQLNNTLKNAIKIIVGNKIDLEMERVISQDEGKALAEKYGCLFTETSAKSGVDVADAFDLLVTEIRKSSELMEDVRKREQSILQQKQQSKWSCC